jgi:hypothetical protein
MEMKTMMNDDKEINLKFELADLDGIQTYNGDFTYDVSWVKLIGKFADFLTLQYSYPVKDRLVFLTDFPEITMHDGADNYITNDEYQMVLKNRERSDLFNDWDGEE